MSICPAIRHQSPSYCLMGDQEGGGQGASSRIQTNDPWPWTPLCLSLHVHHELPPYTERPSGRVVGPITLINFPPSCLPPSPLTQYNKRASCVSTATMATTTSFLGAHNNHQPHTQQAPSLHLLPCSNSHQNAHLLSLSPVSGEGVPGGAGGPENDLEEALMLNVPTTSPCSSPLRQVGGCCVPLLIIIAQPGDGRHYHG